jgi:DNA-binding Lrp family transcriptional regulator
MLENLDKKIIAAMQEEFPLVAQPYKVIAERLGITEAELLNRLNSYRQSGALRKMGTVLRHRQVGFAANALCVWQVPEEQLHRAGAKLAAHAVVTHCYTRVTSKVWPYNLYAMIHAASREECREIAGRVADTAGLPEPFMLFSIREWKKTSMRYFSESIENRG